MREGSESLCLMIILWNLFLAHAYDAKVIVCLLSPWPHGLLLRGSSRYRSSHICLDDVVVLNTLLNNCCRLIAHTKNLEFFWKELVARCAWLLISKDEQKKAGIQAVKKRESKNSKKWEGGEPVSIFLNSLINPPPRPLLKTVSRVKTSNIKISSVGGFHTLAMFVWLCTPAQPGDWRNCCASNP